MIVPETQRFMAERMKAKIKAHAVDHTPSVTAPTLVVDIIRDAISAVTGELKQASRGCSEAADFRRDNRYQSHQQGL